MARNWMDSWKELFAKHILMRGYDYYQDGRVWDIVAEDSNITALVSGTEEYHVMIQFEQDDAAVSAMDCDCPYAADGNCCKHEAAVLYKLCEDDEREIDSGLDSPLEDFRKEILNERVELMGIIEKIPEEELKDMIYQFAMRDKSLKNRLLTKYRESISNVHIQQMKEYIRNIKYEYADRTGFVDWRNASDYILAMNRFMYDNVEPLIDRNLLEAAFELACEVFITIGNAEIDDNGDIDIGAKACCKLWGKIADKASDEFQKEMYGWFKNAINNETVYDYMEDYLNDFLLTGFHSEELLRIRIKKLDNLISIEETRIRDNSKLMLLRHGIADHVLNRIQTMKELGESYSEILSYYQKYDYIPKVLIEFAEEFRNSNDTEKAVDILVSGKKRDTEKNEQAASDYSKRLIEIYRETGDKQRLLEELLSQIKTYPQSNIHYIIELKRLVKPEEWIKILEQILEADTCSGLKTDIFEEEGMLQELMDEVIKTGSSYVLDRYEKVLRPHYSDQILSMYEEKVRKGAEQVFDRRGYRYLMKELKKLTRYRGGREVAREIASEWKKTYSRRPAFMDELANAGF